MTMRKGQFGKGSIVDLTEGLCVPCLRKNLFSLTAEISRSTQLTNRGKILVLKLPEHNEFSFDYLICNGTGYMVGAVMRSVWIDITVDKDDLIKMARDDFHMTCGHQWRQVLDAMDTEQGHYFHEVESMHSL